MIKDYFTYIKESVDEPEFKIGDMVIVNGEIDENFFTNEKDFIIDIAKDYVTTNMDKDGECAP